MFSLSGKKAFITGGASGIGRAVAEAYVEQGASAVIADVTDGTDVAEEIGASFTMVDVSGAKSYSGSHWQLIQTTTA